MQLINFMFLLYIAKIVLQHFFPTLYINLTQRYLPSLYVNLSFYCIYYFSCLQIKYNQFFKRTEKHEENQDQGFQIDKQIYFKNYKETTNKGDFDFVLTYFKNSEHVMFDYSHFFAEKRQCEPVNYKFLSTLVQIDSGEEVKFNLNKYMVQNNYLDPQILKFLVKRETDCDNFNSIHIIDQNANVCRIDRTGIHFFKDTYSLETGNQ